MLLPVMVVEVVLPGAGVLLVKVLLGSFVLLAVAR